MNHKLLSLLGLARRAGKLEAGFDAAAISAREKKACLLLASRDISDKTYHNLCYEAERANIPVSRLDFDRETVGNACGTKAGVLAVTDPGFGKALMKLLECPKA